MDLSKFTERARGFIQAAQTIAIAKPSTYIARAYFEGAFG